MLDIKFVRANPDAVKENIKKKFQDEKIPMVDEVIEFDAKYRAAKTRCDELRAQRNKKSKEIGGLMAKGQKDEAEKVKAEVKAMADEMTRLEEDEKVFAEEVKNRMMVIPNIIDPSVPIGKDDSENVENERFGEPVVPDFEVPYHVDIMESFDGIDLDAARRTSGNGFETLPIRIFGMTKKAVTPKMYALATIIFIVTMSLLLISNLVGSDDQKKQKRVERKHKRRQAQTEKNG